MIYQWKQDIKRKAYKDNKVPQKLVASFAEVKIQPALKTTNTNKEPIIMRYDNVVLEIRASHNAKDIAAIVRELGGSS